MDTLNRYIDTPEAVSMQAPGRATLPNKARIVRMAGAGEGKPSYAPRLASIRCGTKLKLLLGNASAF